jgi:pimeloyl-ACP methyl ester carboxylesterase
MAPELIDVPVCGGKLRVATWGRGETAVIASHGLTGSHLLWSRVAEELPPWVTLIAPDQRGRGRSSALPGPYGIEVHAADLLAVADHLGIGPAIWAGNSIGAWVVSVAAARWPDRVSGLILVDGGLTDLAEMEESAPGDSHMEEPTVGNSDAQTRASLGPGFDRLSMSFPSAEAYQKFWQEHPAFRESSGWNEHVAAYIAYDLTGEPPELRSCVSLEAARADSADVLHNATVRTGLQQVTCPVRLIRASRGALDQPEPHIPDSVVDQYRRFLPSFTDVLVPATNHLTLPHSPGGAATIARSLEALI